MLRRRCGDLASERRCATTCSACGGRWASCRPSSSSTARRSRYPLSARTHSTDFIVFGQTFVSEPYACLDDLTNVDLIVDCGANVGFVSAFLLSQFPTASLVAIEPDPDTFQILQRNLTPYGSRARAELAESGRTTRICASRSVPIEVVGRGRGRSANVRPVRRLRCTRSTYRRYSPEVAASASRSSRSISKAPSVRCSQRLTSRAGFRWSIVWQSSCTTTRTLVPAPRSSAALSPTSRSRSLRLASLTVCRRTTRT